MEQDFNLLEILKILVRNAKTIIIASLIVGIVTAGVSLLLPNYFEASTTFYAASPDLSNPTPINSSQNNQRVYGNNEDIDRLLSISKSNELVLHLIDTFNLYEHYEIDPKGTKAKYKIRQKLMGAYNVLKTKFGGISLSIEDTSPEMAAAMANEAREKISTLSQSIIKNSQLKTLDNYRTNLIEKEVLQLTLNDSLRNIKSKYGIIDLGSQGEVLATNSSEVTLDLTDYKGRVLKMKQQGIPQDSINKTESILGGLVNKKKEIDKQLKNFNNGSAQIRTLEAEIGIINGQLGMLKERYNQLMATYQAPFTTLHVIESADVPVVKSKPRRSILVIGASILTAIFTSLLLLLMHSLKGVSWK